MKSMSHLHVNVYEPFSDYCLEIISVPDNFRCIISGAHKTRSTDIGIYVL